MEGSTQDDCSETQSKTTSRKFFKPQKQPGQYLCIDTRTEAAGGITSNSHLHSARKQSTSRRKESSYSSGRRKQTETPKGSSSVQPDSLCKLKTTLAINYAKAITQQRIQSAPVKRRTPNLKKLSNQGRLKPLLGNHSHKDSEVTILGTDNDQYQTLIDGIDRAYSSHFTAFSASPFQDSNAFDIDLRKLSIVEFANRVDVNGNVLHVEREDSGLEEQYHNKRKMKREDLEQHLYDKKKMGKAEIDLEQQYQNEEKCKADSNVAYSDYNHDDIDDYINNDVSDDGSVGDNNYDINILPEEESVSIKPVCNHESVPHQNTTCDKLHSSFESYGETPEDHPHSKTTKETFATEKSLQKHDASQELDTIQVKDIWKALNDGGFDISREEVSKYKFNSSKSRHRIKSAPPRRNANNLLPSKNTMRARSARSRNDLNSGTNSSSDVPIDPQEKHLSDKDDKYMETERSKVKTVQKNLEVIAVSKPVSELPRKVKLVSPLNFKINTRPKPGHFFYFAYGLNMNQKRLDIQLRCNSGVKYWALLFGFRLLFNKKGSFEGDVGFPNIVADSGFSVEGCAYELPQDRLPLLDTCVGFPKHYARLVVPVWLCNSQNPNDHGVAQHCVPAVVYTAQNDWVVQDPTTLDCSFTLKQCYLGTDILTPRYQEFLRSLMIE